MRSPFKKRSNPTASTASQSSLETQRSHTEKIAYELSQTRQLLKRPGDQNTDWETAERIVKNPVRKALYRCHRPFIRLEKNTWEPLLAWANNQALLSLLGLVGNIGLIIAVATYIGSEKQRRNAEVLNAWQTITSAHGQAGSGGRIQALEFLNASPGANWRRKFPWVCAPLSLCLWDSEDLNGIDISVDVSGDVALIDQARSLKPSQYHELDRGVYLKGINLIEADLRDANLSGANLDYSNLSGAILRDANLAGVSMWHANLSNADLWLANLSSAILRATNLEDANLDAAELVGADLRSANLTGANLAHTNLARANLGDANLDGANLGDANLDEAELVGADLRFAKLSSTKYLNTEQLAQAKLCETWLPEDINLPWDRDCEELGIPIEP